MDQSIPRAPSLTPPAVDLARGHYARKQILCKGWLISWSHRSRYKVGLDLARRFAGKTLLDYGCGDGTFLALLAGETFRPTRAVGVEIHSRLVVDCRERLGHLSGVSFQHVDELDTPEHHGAYDAIFCTEVLEHVVNWQPPLERFERLLAPGGALVISVPVEIGPALVVKQVMRRIAGWRGIGDYPGQSPYTFGELWSSLFAGHRQHMPRPVHTGRDGSPFHDHKGFNWRVLRETLASRFDLRQTSSSPLPFLPVCLASQVWFLLQQRPKATEADRSAR